MLKNNLAEKPENYDMADDVKASTFMTETEVQATVASNVNDNREGDFPLPPKGGAATKAVEENTVNKDDPDISRPLSIEDIHFQNRLYNGCKKNQSGCLSFRLIQYP